MSLCIRRYPAHKIIISGICVFPNLFKWNCPLTQTRKCGGRCSHPSITIKKSDSHGCRARPPAAEACHSPTACPAAWHRRRRSCGAARTASWVSASEAEQEPGLNLAMMRPRRRRPWTPRRFRGSGGQCEALPTCCRANPRRRLRGGGALLEVSA